MHRLSLRSLALIPALICATLALATPALAIEDCPQPTRANVLYTGSGMLESVAVDRKGRVFFTDSTNGTLMRYRPGREPRVIVDGIDGPGGIVFKRNGDLLVGFGNSIAQASDGEANPQAGLLRVDPRTGKSSVFVEGLQMANGVARGPGATIYASNDVGTGIDRIQHRGVELGWATLASPNGLIADSSNRYLFANQTFAPAAIQRIPFDHPESAKTFYSAGPADIAAGFDGLTRDGQDRIYVAANGAGQVWRVSGPGEACSLFTRDPFPSGPSDVAFGRGHGVIPKRSLIVTTFGGELLELQNAR